MSNILILNDKNFKCPLIGVDEVGRGALAGPVCAGAVHYDLEHICSSLEDIKDSKKMSKIQRDIMSEELQKHTLFALGEASVEEINEFGILESTLLAMKRAIEKILLQKNNDYLILIDGISKINDLNLKQITVKKGDNLSWHIAAASIIAKVYRDKLMSKIGEKSEYKCFNWQKNSGYGTQEHIQNIIKNGITPLHRKLFVRKLY